MSENTSHKNLRVLLLLNTRLSIAMGLQLLLAELPAAAAAVCCIELQRTTPQGVV
jgi:hypothetical protein